MVKSVSEIGAPSRSSPQTILREATDRTLLLEVIQRGRVTRAELAEATGLSKPTVSEAVRRLTAAGLLASAGAQETGRRGRVGTFFELAATAGWVLAIELDQSGVKSRSADLAGRVFAEHDCPPGPVGDTSALTASLRSTVVDATSNTEEQHGPLRAVSVSNANPVDPVTSEVIAIAEAPFPEGFINAGSALGDLVTAPVLVDNDVNLAALAELRAGGAIGAASFAYVYVGAGLGLGLYLGGQLIRGAHGLAGEIAYLPGSRLPGTLGRELAASGLGRADAPSTDVSAALLLLDRVDRREGSDEQQQLTILTAAIARAVASVMAVIDPELVLLGGPLGTHPALLDAVRDAVAAMSPSPALIAPGTLGALAPLYGALQLALDHAIAAAVTTTPAG